MANPLKDKGYFPLWRKITEWGWYKDGSTMRVFIHLMLLANFKENHYLGHKILPGQVVSGRKSLALSLRLGERAVRTALSHLKATNEITIENHNRFSIITLINFNEYTITTSEKSNRSPEEVRQPTTPNNDKNGKNDKKERIPSSLDSVKDFFKELNHPDQADLFYDHFQSNGWKVGGKTPMKDWKAAARNWCRRNFGKIESKKEDIRYPEFEEEKEVKVDHSPEGQAKVSKLIKKSFGDR